MDAVWTSMPRRASGPETTPVQVPETATETQLSPPWNVIVHDDPVTLMSYVTMVLQKLFGYSLEKAHGMMMEVHETGRSLVWTGERERAEFYVSRLHGFQLLATMERAES